MAEPKPPGLTFETWVERQIREALERGGFDNLAGAGAPLRDLDKPYEDVWVLRQLRSEDLSTVGSGRASRRRRWWGHGLRRHQSG